MQADVQRKSRRPCELGTIIIHAYNHKTPSRWHPSEQSTMPTFRLRRRSNGTAPRNARNLVMIDRWTRAHAVTTASPLPPPAGGQISRRPAARRSHTHASIRNGTESAGVQTGGRAGNTIYDKQCGGRRVQRWNRTAGDGWRGTGRNDARRIYAAAETRTNFAGKRSVGRSVAVDALPWSRDNTEKNGMPEEKIDPYVSTIRTDESDRTHMRAQACRLHDYQKKIKIKTKTRVFMRPDTNPCFLAD